MNKNIKLFADLLLNNSIKPYKTVKSPLLALQIINLKSTL